MHRQGAKAFNFLFKSNYSLTFMSNLHEKHYEFSMKDGVKVRSLMKKTQRIHRNKTLNITVAYVKDDTFMVA